MSLAVLGLGSNLGNRENLMAHALNLLEKTRETKILKLSSIYETEPVDVVSKQNAYLNCCVLLETKLSPDLLLDSCLEIEKQLGRVRIEYHGSRTMDIDLLLYENFQSSTEKLRLPHPEIRNRAFVMVPLSDLFQEKIALGFDFKDAMEAVDKIGVNIL